MKKFLLSSTLLMSVLFACSNNTMAGSMEDARPRTPRTAVVSRHNATLLVKENVRVNKGKFSIVVPSSVLAQSFVLQTQGMDVMSTDLSLTPIYIKNIPLVQTRAEIKKKIQQLTTKIDAIDARVKVLSSSQQVFTSAKDIGSLDSALGSRFEYLYTQKSALQQQKDGLVKELRSVEQALVQATGSIEPSYSVLNVTLVDKKLDGNFDIVYSYIVNNAGWNPLYQVNADVTKKTVTSKFTVELWQRTALNWSTTNIILTTATPTTSPEPVHLAPWNVTVNKPTPQPKAMMARHAPQTLELYADDSAPAIVESVSNAMQWSLGKQLVPAGETQVIPISTSVFDAEFFYTLRPYASNEAFFTARLKSNKQVTLPGGRANYTVAGLGVGQGTFKYIPNDNNVVYFGKDPLVTGTMTLQRNDLVTTKKDQTKTYEWKITVQNKRKNTVRVFVQDVKPETTSPQISISSEWKSLPQTNTDTQFIEWEIPSLKSNKSESIIYKVTFTAPLDIEIVTPR